MPATTAINVNALRGVAMTELCKIDDPDVLSRVVASLKRTIARVIDPPVVSQYEYDALKESLAEVAEARRKGVKLQTVESLIDELRNNQ